MTEGKIGVLSVSSLFLTQVGVYVGVCGCIRTHTHTHCTDGVLGCRDKTPGEPEESGSTKAQYTCRPYRYTRYICLYICWAAGFDDLGYVPFFRLTCLFF